jgi:hypothetical protein
MLVLYLHTKFHIRNYIVSWIIAGTLKAKWTSSHGCHIAESFYTLQRRLVLETLHIFRVTIAMHNFSLLIRQKAIKSKISSS